VKFFEVLMSWKDPRCGKFQVWKKNFDFFVPFSFPKLRGLTLNIGFLMNLENMNIIFEDKVIPPKDIFS